MAVHRIYPGVRLLFPLAVTKIESPEKLLCLTFDDGPHPGSTPIIAKILGKYNVKAIFFCTGEKAVENPSLISMLVSEGHIIGNHSFNHPDGFIATTKKYVENVRSANKLTSDSIFRPPFGRMRLSQYRILSKLYRIVLWDVIVYDYKIGVSGEKILSGLQKKVRSGSIIALHDKPESIEKNFLEEFIKVYIDKGFSFIKPNF